MKTIAGQNQLEGCPLEDQLALITLDADQQKHFHYFVEYAFSQERECMKAVRRLECMNPQAEEHNLHFVYYEALLLRLTVLSAWQDVIYFLTGTLHSGVVPTVLQRVYKIRRGARRFINTHITYCCERYAIAPDSVADQPFTVEACTYELGSIALKYAPFPSVAVFNALEKSFAALSAERHGYGTCTNSAIHPSEQALWLAYHLSCAATDWYEAAQNWFGGVQSVAPEHQTECARLMIASLHQVRRVWSESQTALSSSWQLWAHTETQHQSSENNTGEDEVQG